MRIRGLILGGLIGSCASLAQAQQAAETPICTDRPTRANAVCTVPKGDVQIEADVVNYTRLRQSGAAADIFVYTNPTVKYGLSDASDFEVNWAPWIEVEVETAQGRLRTSGVGDLFVRYKRRLTDPDARIGLSLIPFVKAPTARSGIGNERWEGGLIAPINTTLPGGVSLTFGPQLDLLAEADGTGRRLGLTNVINVSKSFGKATLYGEFWSFNDFAAETGGDQRTLDFAVAYLLAPRLQIDVGANIGVSANTPNLQLVAGVAHRF